MVRLTFISFLFLCFNSSEFADVMASVISCSSADWTRCCNWSARQEHAVHATLGYISAIRKLSGYIIFFGAYASVAFWEIEFAQNSVGIPYAQEEIICFVIQFICANFLK